MFAKILTGYVMKNENKEIIKNVKNIFSDITHVKLERE